MRRRDIRLKLQQGYLDAALEEASESYKDSEGSDPQWNWRFRLLKAETLVRRAAYRDALSLLESEPPANYPLEITVRRKSIQGLALCLTNDWRSGEAVLKSAESMSGSDPMLLSEIALAEGRCAWSQSELSTAEVQFRRAEQLAEGVQPFLQASAAGNLGLILMQAERYDQAVDKFQEVLDLEHSINSPLLQEKSMGNLANCYAERGDFKKAIALAEQAQALAGEIKSFGDQQMSLINLGWAYSGAGEFDKAENSYLQALPLAEKFHDTDAVVLTYNDLTALSLERKDSNKAEQYWRRGVAALRAGGNTGRIPSRGKVTEDLAATRRLQLTVNQAEIAIARKQYRSAEDLLDATLRSSHMDAVVRSQVQKELGRVYWHENRTKDAERMFLEALRSAERAFAGLSRDEQRLPFLDRDTFYDAYIQFLVAHSRPLDALQIAERNRAQAVAHRTRETAGHETSFSIHILQRALNRSNKTVLAYTVTDDQTFLWVITGKGYKLFTLPGGPNLYPHITRYNQEIQERHSAENSSEAKTLYEELILPAAKLIPKGSHVIIVPSRVVSLVNFESLVVPGAQPYYWLDDVEVEYAGSLRGIVSGTQKAEAETTSQYLLAIGAPVEISKEFPALQHASEEISNVLSHFDANRRKVVTGAQAIPTAYRASDPAKYRYIHFDTHGINSDLSPLDSAIVLSAGPDKEYKLYAREIIQIPIQADLVTISACYGAGTRVYNAEGTIGLGWAFLRAGARQVVAATWEIDDALTAKFMDDFYGELSQGKSAVDALHDAKLHMLHSSTYERHPYYWASLQLYSGY